MIITLSLLEVEVMSHMELGDSLFIRLFLRTTYRLREVLATMVRNLPHSLEEALPSLS